MAFLIPHPMAIATERIIFAELAKRQTAIHDEITELAAQS